MSGPEREPNDMNLQTSGATERERIAAELAALGEAPLSDDEAGWAGLGPDASEPPELEHDVALVRALTLTTARWAEDGHAADETDEAEQTPRPLSEIGQARVWRTVELRTAPRDARPSGDAGSASRGPWLIGAVVVVLAVAATVILVPRGGPEPSSLETEPGVPSEPVAVAPEVSTPTATPPTSEELDVLSMQARASLAALDRLSGQPTGVNRIDALAADYARRLEAEG